MSRIEFREEWCKGCLLCTTVCPKSIITVSTRTNQQGYKVAEVAPDKASECTGCASCAMICPDLVIKVWKTKKAKATKKAGGGKDNG